MHYWPGLTWNEVVWQRSWVNLNMLLASIPDSGTDGEESKKEDANPPEKMDEIKSFFAGL